MPIDPSIVVFLHTNYQSCTIRFEKIPFIILYSMVTAVAIMASGYLLFRRSNAFVPDITSPTRLRRCPVASGNVKRS